MEDREILALCLARDQRGALAAEEKYGTRCHVTAYRILRDQQEAERCVNEAFLQAWEEIPSCRPRCLGVFLQKITRKLALDRLESYPAGKLEENELPMALVELAECVPAGEAAAVDDQRLAEELNGFLAALPVKERVVFLRRYWYLQTVPEIAQETAASPKKVKALLASGRQALRDYLQKREVAL